MARKTACLATAWRFDGISRWDESSTAGQLAVIGYGRGGFKESWASMTSFGKLDEPCSRTAHRRGGDRVRYHMYAALYSLWFDLSSYMYLERLRIDVEGKQTCLHVRRDLRWKLELSEVGSKLPPRPSHLAFESTARDLLPKHGHSFATTTTPNHCTLHSHTHGHCRITPYISAHANKTRPPCSAAGSRCRCASPYSHAYS